MEAPPGAGGAGSSLTPPAQRGGWDVVRASTGGVQLRISRGMVPGVLCLWWGVCEVQEGAADVGEYFPTRWRCFFRFWVTLYGHTIFFDENEYLYSKRVFLAVLRKQMA